MARAEPPRVNDDRRREFTFQSEVVPVAVTAAGGAAQLDAIHRV